MDPTLRAFLTSWSLLPEVLVGLLLVVGVYVRGWMRLQRHGSWHPGPRHLACFLSGLATLYVAVASPLDPFGFYLLQVHMFQHVLLMFVAPPLIWLGEPVMPCFLGLPAAVRRYWVAPLVRLRIVRAFFDLLARPVVAWTLFVLVLWGWHAPQLYQLALDITQVHYLEHASFFWAGMVFWWPVIRPYPARVRFSRWVLLPYLFLAGVQGTVLSGLLTFAGRVIYPHYAAMPRLWGVSPLTDQALAGAVMWIPGSLAFLIPLVWIGSELLYGMPERAGSQGLAMPSPRARRSGRKWPPDLLDLPLAGRFLRWRHARLTMQIPMLALAGLVIFDGLFGPQIAPLNLAGVLPWIHWRGMLILGLLVAGNVCCMVCPFMLPRGLAKRWLPGNRPWPRWLKGKWAAVVLIVAFFWAYEALSLWDVPRRTAWIAIAYFAGAVVIDAVFRRSAFCKHVCPIGQFNFTQSLASPLEVRVRDPAVCRRCTTQDCIRGRGNLSGCGTLLYQPRKAGNMDCTFCFDCIHACPHDNVGIVPGVPAAELRRDPIRAGIGRFSRQTDLAVMVTVLVFAAFVNAAGMIGPVVTWQDDVMAALGLDARWPVVTIGILVGLVLVPGAAVAAAAVVSRQAIRRPESTFDVARRFAFTLIPLGFGMWLAHYMFHFLTSYDAVIPAARRLASDLGLVAAAGSAGAYCVPPSGNWLLVLEILFLDLGLVVSLYSAYRTAREYRGGLFGSLLVFAPWAGLMLGLFAVGIWILFQPMQMRGTMMMNMAGMQ